MSTLPENWKVKITEDNREVLEQWRIQQPHADENTTCFEEDALNHWLISDHYDGTYMNWGLVENHIEITFQQFKQFVLMENKPQFKIGDKVIIKRDSEGYGTSGWMGEFQDIIRTQGYLTVSKVTNIKDSIQQISFKEIKYCADSSWLIPYIETKTEMKTYNIKISGLKKIHDVACPEWKTKIKALIVYPFDESTELSQKQVDEMFKAAQSHQRPVLVEVFGEPVSQCPYKKGQLIWVWDTEYHFPSVRQFIEMDGSKFKAHSNGRGTTTWDNAAPFNNGQLPQQFKHLLENQ